MVNCFEGQGFHDSESYLIDPGIQTQIHHEESDINATAAQLFEAEELDTNEEEEENEYGIKNAPIQLSEEQMLRNIQAVQKQQHSLILSTELIKTRQCKFNLDVEMETGTGKTYCYIKTMFEMNKRYGWSKFIIIVPSIAIREGIHKSFEDTAEHFHEAYNKKARFFIYNSDRLHEIESFSSDGGINVMIINIQAFNAKGKNNRRIYEELDAFQSRRPIDVIKRNNPILILDEPQKMEGSATLEALPKFNPLMILRYSATHKTQHNLIYRLDAIDAYEQKLVKKIEVCGIEAEGLQGTNSYLYLEKIDLSKDGPIAWVELEIKQKSGDIKRQIRKVTKRDHLFTLSNEMEQYHNGYTVAQINAHDNTIEFANGITLQAGTATNDLTENDVRRLQIRETIKAHLEKERELYADGIKVLSLFFIDEVKKYRDYDQADEKGEYARIFEEEYLNERQRIFDELDLTPEHRKYLEKIDVAKTHNGYFSIDKKTERLVNPNKIEKKSGEAKDDVDAYDLILRNKKQLLSFDEDTRFIFSHSALREGWDNPNIFVMCMLKHSSNEISRRQEVGRGLRLCVTQNGERVDDPATVHEINKLTVVASESYKDFVSGLQKEISDSITSRPRKATVEYFKGKIIHADDDSETRVNDTMANQIYRYLVKNDYSTDTDEISLKYQEARANNKLADLPEELKPYAKGIFRLIDSVFSGTPEIDNVRRKKQNRLNDNFDRAEFQELWKRINTKAFYTVEFSTKELIEKCVEALNNELNVKALQYQIRKGKQHTKATEFKSTSIATEKGAGTYAKASYDLIGRIADGTNLTRQTIATILTQIRKERFNQFKENPEHFISETARIITEQKSTTIIEGIQYNTLNERYDVDIFTKNAQDIKDASMPLKKHVYDYVVTDSGKEREFVSDLDKSEEVTVYAKLPSGFSIPTPIGNYNPDWAIAFKERSVTHIYFVAETKGSMSSIALRTIEKAKTDCARKFFEKLNKQNRIKYDVVNNYGKLMDLAQGHD